MSQKVDIICDRCGAVMEGRRQEGAAPHWSVMLDSMSRPAEAGGAYFGAISWDLCVTCARVVYAAITGTGIKPGSTDDAALRFLQEATA